MTHDPSDIDLTDDEIARLVEELAELREDDGIKCACLDRDSVQCAAIRYGMDHWGEPCECPCHQRPDEDDDAPGAPSP